MNLERLATRLTGREAAALAMTVVAGVIAAAAVSTAPVYFRGVERLSLRATVDDFPPAAAGAWVHAGEVAFNPSNLRSVGDAFEEAGAELGELVAGQAVYTRSGLLTARLVDDAPTPAFPGGWHYQSVAGDAPLLTYVRGGAPVRSGMVEAAIPAAVAERFGIEVGDRVVLTVPPTDIVHSTVRVVGMFEAASVEGAEWVGLYRTLFEPRQGASGGTPPIVALVDDSTLAELAAGAPADLGSAWATYRLDAERVAEREIASTLGALESFERAVGRLLPEARAVSGIGSALESLERRLAFGQATTRVAGSLVIAVMLMLWLLLARAILETRLRDRASLESRGATRGQVTRSLAAGAVLIALVPTLLGPLVASGLVPQLGRTSGFRAFTGGDPLAYALTWEQFALAGLVSVAVAGYYLAPLVMTRVGALVLATRGWRRNLRPWVWRGNLDVAVIVAAGVLVYEVAGGGGILDADGGLSAGAALLPVAVAVGAALVALRAFRVVGAVIGWIARLPVEARVAMPAMLLSRSIMGHGTPMLVGAAVAVVGVTASGIQDTIVLNSEHRARFAAVADVRITNVNGFRGEENDDVQRVLALPWVGEHAWSIRTVGGAGVTELAPEFALLAVPPERLAAVGWFRSDFADRDLAGLMGELREYGGARRLELPAGTVAIALEAELRAESEGRVDLWARLIDAGGRTHTLQLDVVGDAESVSRYRADVPMGLPAPVSVLAIEVYEPPVAPIGDPVRLHLRGLEAVGDEGSRVEIAGGFGDAGGWQALAASLADNAVLMPAAEGLTVEFGRGTDEGIRGVYPVESGSEGIRVPLVVNDAFLERTGLGVGDAFTGQALGRYVPFVVRGSYGMFPSLAEVEEPSAVANVEALLGYATIVSEPFIGNSAEVIARLEDGGDGGGGGAEGRRSAIKAVNPAMSVVDRAGLVAGTTIDPAAAAGWQYLGTAATVVTIVGGVLAVVAFGQTFVAREARNWALMQSVGASGLSTVLDGVLRLALPVALGIVGVGLPAGVFGVRWFADNLSRTVDGATAVPPQVLAIDWLPVVVAGVVVLVASVLPAVLTFAERATPVAVRLRRLGTWVQ